MVQNVSHQVFFVITASNDLFKKLFYWDIYCNKGVQTNLKRFAMLHFVVFLLLPFNEVVNEAELWGSLIIAHIADLLLSVTVKEF